MHRLFSRLLRVTALWCALGMSHHLAAQSVSALAPLRVSADTARMAWGHLDFTRYPDVAACTEAIRDAQRQVERNQALEFIAYDLVTDTLPTVAVAVARACAAHFPAFFGNAELPPAFTADSTVWWSVARVALALKDDRRAAQAINHAVTDAKTSADRGEALLRATNLYLMAQPSRIVAAQALGSQFGALGAAGRIAQFDWHECLLKYWTRSYIPDSMRQHATAMIALSRLMTTAERDGVFAVGPYLTFIALAGDQGDTVAQRTWLDRMNAEVGSWHDGQGIQFVEGLRSQTAKQRSVYGQSARVLKGQHWFHAGSTTHPRRGVVSLLVKAPHHNCGNGCLPFFTMLRTLAERYGAELDVTLVSETEGFMVNSGVLSVDEEAKAAAKYYLDFLRLPVALLVDVTTIRKRADGRVIRTPSAVGAIFDGWDCIVVDREGVIRWIGGLNTQAGRNETGLPRLDAVIRRAMRS